MFRSINTKNMEIFQLANKYNVPMPEFGKYAPSCPGIMSPLSETPFIDIKWVSSNIPDKVNRHNQFYKSLKALDSYFAAHENLQVLKEKYLELDIHGRAMFSKIVSLQPSNQATPIFKAISHYAAEGINLHTIPYDKGGVTVKTIFDKYITPTIKNYDPTFSLNTPTITSYNNDDDINLSFAQDEDAMLQIAINESLKIQDELSSKDLKLKAANINNNSLFTPTTTNTVNEEDQDLEYALSLSLKEQEQPNSNDLQQKNPNVDNNSTSTTKEDEAIEYALSLSLKLQEESNSKDLQQKNPNVDNNSTSTTTTTTTTTTMTEEDEDTLLAKALSLSMQSNNTSFTSIPAFSKIELREFEINLPWMKASHRFFVRYNGEGKIVGEFHGLATDPISGNFKPLGLGGNDLLKAYEYPLKNQPLSIPASDGGYFGLYKQSQPAKTLLAGNEAEIQERWNAAHEGVQALNFRKISYNVFGGELKDLNSGNSNSIARTLGDIMGLPNDKISENIIIGQEKNLLPKESYPDLYHDNWNTDNVNLAGEMPQGELPQHDLT